MGVDGIRPKSDMSNHGTQPVTQSNRMPGSTEPIDKNRSIGKNEPIGKNVPLGKSTPGGNTDLEVLKAIYGEKKLKQIGVIPCVTCANRVYQDGSNDPGVSFKSPTHVSPEQSHSMVMAHENEHVQREQQKADQEDRDVVSQSVTLSRSICPECGKSYISGGVTKTTTQSRPRYNEPTNEELKGLFVDKKM